MQWILDHKVLIALGVYKLIDELFAFSPALKSNSILNLIYNLAKGLGGAI